VQFWHAWSGQTGQALQQLVDDFNARNSYGITVQVAYQGNYNALDDKIQAALASPASFKSSTRALPDVTLGSISQILTWQQAGGDIVDLNTYVEDPAWGYTPAEQADFYPVFWKQAVVKGVRLGLPAQQTAEVMVYNQTWASALGFSAPPKTPVEFQKQACAATQANNSDAEADNDNTGGWIVSTTPETIYTWLAAFGSQVVTPGGMGYQFNTPASRAAVEYLKRLHDSNCTWQVGGETATGGYGAGEYIEAGFATRRALFATSPLGNLPYLADALQRAANHDRWGVFAFPSLQGRPTITVYGPSFCMFSDSPEVQLASWIFMKWLSLPANQAKLVAASGTYPLRAATLDFLDDYAAGHPQWAAAVKLLPDALNEPALRSWDTVRWAVGDLGSQIFRYYFTTDRIPASLDLLDETARELSNR
jgi:multiple sugar transport system substrate-binding protein